MYEAYGVSDNGLTIVGVAADFALAGDRQRAFRWTYAHGMQDLNVNQGPSDRCGATAVSGDGGVIVGDCSAGAFRWNGEVLTYPWVGSATGISHDGAFVVGTVPNGSSTLGVRWNADAGVQYLGFDEPLSANSDGSVVVGDTMVQQESRAVSWTAPQGPVYLPTPLGLDCGGVAVSGDGAFVVGCQNGLGACFWENGAPAVDLNSYLRQHGIDLTGWSLLCAYGVSMDGQVVAGIGLHSGDYEGWVAYLGRRCGSADFNHDGAAGTDSDVGDFFACIAGGCCPTCDSADFNGDGAVATDADIEAFFRVLAGLGC
jgi:uncharacterized membrane protein